MLTYYCPKCWTVLNAKELTCPNCGYALDEHMQMPYEDKLLIALHHVVPERRIMAAQILGNQKSQRALPEFLKIIEGDETDYFVLRAVLFAAAKINHPDREIILQKATLHDSDLVALFAKELLARLSDHHKIDDWDQNTG